MSRGGLSPRVRGSHLDGRDAHGRRRSIPACAGEPLDDGRRVVGVEVYPRVCGGASIRLFAFSITIGLSPRVRGSPLAQIAERVAGGSIPACAGEPHCHSPLGVTS